MYNLRFRPTCSSVKPCFTRELTDFSNENNGQILPTPLFNLLLPDNIHHSDNLDFVKSILLANPTSFEFYIQISEHWTM